MTQTSLHQHGHGKKATLHVVMGKDLPALIQRKAASEAADGSPGKGSFCRRSCLSREAKTSKPKHFYKGYMSTSFKIMGNRNNKN